MTATPVRIGYRPSNGTEGVAFRAQWCEGCEHEHSRGNHPEIVGPGCPILMDSFIPERVWPSMTHLAKVTPEQYPDPPYYWGAGPIVWYRTEDGPPECAEYEPCSCNEGEHAPDPFVEGPRDQWTPRPVMHVEGQEPML